MRPNKITTRWLHGWKSPCYRNSHEQQPSEVYKVSLGNTFWLCIKSKRLHGNYLKLSPALQIQRRGHVKTIPSSLYILERSPRPDELPFFFFFKSFISLIVPRGKLTLEQERGMEQFSSWCWPGKKVPFSLLIALNLWILLPTLTW